MNKVPNTLSGSQLCAVPLTFRVGGLARLFFPGADFLGFPTRFITLNLTD